MIIKKMSTKITNPYDKSDVLRALKNAYLKEDSSAIKQIHDWVKDFDMVVITKNRNNGSRMAELFNPENYKINNTNKTILIIYKPSFLENFWFDNYYFAFKSLKYLENYDDLSNIKNILDFDYTCIANKNVHLYVYKMLKIKENVKIWKDIYQRYIVILGNTDGTISIIINPYLNNPIKTPVIEEADILIEEKTLEIDYKTKYKELKKKYKTLKEKYEELSLLL